MEKLIPQPFLPGIVRHSLIILLVVCIAAPVEATTWYVKPGGTGTGSGSWSNAAAATQLATIIAGAASGDQVWVVGTTSGATYYPTTGTSRTVAFVLKSGVSVYGGFAGTETALGQQQPATYISILSGDIGTVGSNTDNSYNVVVASTSGGTATLSGFTITNGNASGSSPYNMGGGIYNSGMTVSYINCIITNNTAVSGGGGAYVAGSGTVTFTNCTFSSNSTTVAASPGAGGGGLAIIGGKSILTGCSFSSNISSSEGGGVFSYNSSIDSINTTTFTGNVASGDGGGIAGYSAASYLISCTFTSNISNSASTSGGGGGAYTNTGTGMQLTTCTFTSNKANYNGGGYFDNGGSSLPVSYCTFTSNSANYGGGVCSYNGTSPGVTNCTFSNNLAYAAGGGACNNGVGAGDMKVDTFLNNTANDTAYNTTPVAGGGVCNTGGSNVALVHCILQGNVASHGDGGGLYDLGISNNNDSSDIFMANKSNNGNGGGMADSSGNTKFFKCVFADNQCALRGGGAYIGNNSGTLESCTFFNNQANSAGGYGDGIYENGSNFKILGNMVWSRTSTSIGVVGAPVGSKVQYNDIINGTAYAGSNGNIVAAPTFGNSGNYTGTDGMWETADDGLHLTNGSYGTDSVTSGSYYGVSDIVESVRPDNGGTKADMGAYESAGTFATLLTQLLQFTALSTGNNTVALAWNVDPAAQVAQYAVQRSANGTDFAAIGTIQVMTGQSNYRYIDANASAPVLYYRLLMIMNDGSRVLSTIVVIDAIRSGASQASLRPSVTTTGITTLYIGTSRAAVLNLTVTDLSGRVLYRKGVTVSQGDNYIALDLSPLNKGLYYVAVVEAGGEKWALPLVRF